LVFQHHQRLILMLSLEAKMFDKEANLRKRSTGDLKLQTDDSLVDNYYFFFFFFFFFFFSSSKASIIFFSSSIYCALLSSYSFCLYSNSFIHYSSFSDKFFIVWWISSVKASWIQTSKIYWQGITTLPSILIMYLLFSGFLKSAWNR